MTNMAMHNRLSSSGFRFTAPSVGGVARMPVPPCRFKGDNNHKHHKNGKHSAPAPPQPAVENLPIQEAANKDIKPSDLYLAKGAHAQPLESKPATGWHPAPAAADSPLDDAPIKEAGHTPSEFYKAKEVKAVSTDSPQKTTQDQLPIQETGHTPSDFYKAKEVKAVSTPSSSKDVLPIQEAGKKALQPSDFFKAEGVKTTSSNTRNNIYPAVPEYGPVDADKARGDEYKGVGEKDSKRATTLDEPFLGPPPKTMPSAAIYPSPNHMPRQARAPTLNLSDHTVPQPHQSKTPSPGKGPAATTSGSTSRSGLSAANAPGPVPIQPPMGMPIPRVASAVCGVLSAGWVALALTLLAANGTAAQLFFPTAVGQAGNRLLVALWGASLLPVAAAVIAFKGIIDTGMAGTGGADQLGGSVLVGSVVTLVVVMQAVSLRHVPFDAFVGSLSAATLALTAWIASRTHKWSMTPMPNPTAVARAVVSSFHFPRSWAALAYTCVSTGLIAAGISIMRASAFGAPAVLLGGTSAVLGAAAPASNLAIFVGRAAGGAMITSGLICGLLSAASDRMLLPARLVQMVNASVCVSSTLVAAIIGLGMMVGTAAPSSTLVALLLGQLAAGAWTFCVYQYPQRVQGRSLFAEGSGYELRAPPREVPAQKMSEQQVWEALAAAPTGDEF